MPKIKITAYLEVDEDMVDRDHSTGLTQAGYEDVMDELIGLDDVETELVEDGE